MLVTVTDKRIAVDTENDGIINYYSADVVTANDYFPFGMQIPGRKFSSNSGYRYGFNGKEQDKETTGTSTYDYGFRIYNPALGRFLSVDPLSPNYPWYTPFQFAGNKPIEFIDLDGLEEIRYTEINSDSRTARIQIVKNYEVVTSGVNAVSDLNFVRNNLNAAANIYNSNHFKYKFVNQLASSTNEMKQAGWLTRSLFNLKNIFNSKSKRQENYQKKYWTVHVDYNVTDNATSGTTDASADNLIKTNSNLNGKIIEQTFEPSANIRGVGARGRVKIENATSSDDDLVILNSVFYGLTQTRRNELGQNGSFSSSEGIAHEIGHNLCGNTHPGSDGTGESYPSNGLGANTSGNVYPTKDQTKKIINNSKNTIPVVLPSNTP